MKAVAGTIRLHDVVGYRDKVKRKLFGDMEVVALLANNRVDVRKVPDPNRPKELTMVWSEFLSDLVVVDDHYQE